MSLATRILNSWLNYRSFKTDRKLIVFESDDWGSRRTDSLPVRDRLNTISKDVLNDPFSQLDNLASAEDINALFDVLRSVRDKNGNHPCFTINVTTANPDFEKIRQNKFERFAYEPFYDTIQNRTGGQEVLNLWQAGIREKLFFPQLHGREHVHALAWLKELQAGNTELLKAFDLCAYGIPYKALYKQRRKNLQAALDVYGLDGEETFQQQWVKESADIFESYFGFRSKTFIPTAYIWHPRIEQTLTASGVEAIQGLKLQYQPVADDKVLFKRRTRFTGEQSASGVRHLARNTFFEPFSENKDWVDFTLSRINEAFSSNQPAIIGTHRINYIGSISSRNRDNTLRMLSGILRKTVKHWGNVEFVHSGHLVNLISLSK